MNNLKFIILFILKKFITEIPQNTNDPKQPTVEKPTDTLVRVTLSR